MKATDKKDTMRSYMIIPCPPEAGTTGYQYRMLEMNRIEGILPCGLRHIDGESFLYYETTGKQSLSALYEGRRIPGTELFGLLEALNDVSGTLSGYLLDEQNLVLTGEQIFYDLSSGKYFFTYYPGEVVEPDVFRFLADGIDGTDKRAAAAAYRLCASVGADRQALREVIRKEVSQRDTPKPWEIETEEPAEDCTAKSESPDFDSSGHHTLRTAAKPERNTEYRQSRDPEPELGKKQFVFRILLIVLLLAGAGGLFAVQLLVYISQRERRLCIAGSILLLVSACLIIAETVLRVRESRRKRREDEQSRNPSYLESDEKDLPVFGTGKAEDYRLVDEETGNTVRFSEQETIGRLYGRDRGSRIDLRTLPTTVGKAQAYVDVVLPDPSVSRVHARIYKGEEGCIEIRDLDSTNGTFINGTRLEPNEKKRVHRGDEVRFGNMEYEYR